MTTAVIGVPVSLLRPVVEDILSIACPDPQSAFMFIVAVSMNVQHLESQICLSFNCLLLFHYVFVCVA